ncbi:MAG: hypothetical protein H6726_19285 [Sandaracinaceae bacterium]|nr:hypothetical protein [Myxococcales bacterium]MCB9659801.1 hypothetical protein [Sandaracinaceae bacterium]
MTETTTGETAAASENEASAPEGSAAAEAPDEPALTREEAAERVQRFRAASDAAAAAGAHATDAEARIGIASTYVRYASAHPSQNECLPDEPEEAPAPGQARRVRTFHDVRRSARDEAHTELDCAAQRGGDPDVIAALRARLDALRDAAAASCRERGLLPMEGHTAPLMGVLGAPPDPCQRNLGAALGGASSMERVLGIASTGDSGFGSALGGLGTTDPHP